MHQRPRQLLRRLMHQYGSELHADPRRTEAFLQDLCGQYHREIFVLVHAQEQRIPQELLAAGRLAGDAAHWQRLSRRLQDRLALTAEAADWAVESWALALNISPIRHRYPSPVRLLLDRWGRIDWTTLRHTAGEGLLRGRRSFAKIGVQWVQWPRQWPHRWRWVAPVMLAVVLLATALFSQHIPTTVLGRTLGFWQSDQARLAAEQARLSADVTRWLERLYPLPRAVRIGEEPVPVHVQPAENSELLALLAPAGASILVDAYTADGRWMHVSTPLDGWIEQGGVTHTFTPPDGSVAYAVALMPEVGEITVTALRVRQRPMLDAPILSQLATGDRVLILATTPEGDWLQIVDPVQGWVSSEYVLRGGFTTDIPQKRGENQEGTLWHKTIAMSIEVHPSLEPMTLDHKIKHGLTKHAMIWASYRWADRTKLPSSLALISRTIQVCSL